MPELSKKERDENWKFNRAVERVTALVKAGRRLIFHGGDFMLEGQDSRRFDAGVVLAVCVPGTAVMTRDTSGAYPRLIVAAPERRVPRMVGMNDD